MWVTKQVQWYQGWGWRGGSGDGVEKSQCAAGSGPQLLEGWSCPGWHREACGHITPIFACLIPLLSLPPSVCQNPTFFFFSNISISANIHPFVKPKLCNYLISLSWCGQSNKVIFWLNWIIYLVLSTVFITNLCILSFASLCILNRVSQWEGLYL